MRVITHNVNGIRAALRRGFTSWLAQTDADAIALQEVRCPVEALPLDAFGDYHVVYDPGSLPGRNGVALLTREPVAASTAWSGRVYAWGPGEVPSPLPAVATHADDALDAFAHEGRWIAADLAGGGVRLASLYLPKGGVPAHLVKTRSREGRTPEQEQARFDRKQGFMAAWARDVAALAQESVAQGRDLLVVGDFNIAHAPADLSNWRGNQATDGFLPAERIWFDDLVGADPSSLRLPEAVRNPVAPQAGPLVDVVRALHPDQDGPYSWWSWRGRAFTNDVGWRIDYHLATPGLARTAHRAWVDRAGTYEERISDHAPVGVDYAL
ncbi:MAG: endonuclease/exonuclease/phosphatase family protein [Actinomycetia bacterium]|nr:endonuclease/exonuclease/phosphatase family protein [Actinomycetes bacterium]